MDNDRWAELLETIAIERDPEKVRLLVKKSTESLQNENHRLPRDPHHYSSQFSEMQNCTIGGPLPAQEGVEWRPGEPVLAVNDCTNRSNSRDRQLFFWGGARYSKLV